MRRRLALLAALAVTAAAFPASAGADSRVVPFDTGDLATKSDENLVIYLTTGKIKAKNPISWAAGCPVACSYSASTELKLKGPDLGPVTSSGQLPAFNALESIFKLNKTARSSLKDNIGAAKLVTSFTGTDLVTGVVDTDEVTFKFKK